MKTEISITPVKGRIRPLEKWTAAVTAGCYITICGTVKAFPTWVHEGCGVFSLARACIRKNETYQNLKGYFYLWQSIWKKIVGQNCTGVFSGVLLKGRASGEYDWEGVKAARSTPPYRDLNATPARAPTATQPHRGGRHRAGAFSDTDTSGSPSTVDKATTPSRWASRTRARSSPPDQGEGSPTADNTPWAVHQVRGHRIRCFVPPTKPPWSASS